MRLYRILETGWAGTQADAKAAGKEAGRPWHECEVPTDKPGLLAFLSDRNVPGNAREGELFEQGPLLEREPIAPAPVAPPAPRIDQAQAFTAGQICSFILDQATIAQVENIMAALGTRFAELAKERKRA